MQEFVNKNLMYHVICGSYSYGLNTPTSDVDKKGITIPPKEYFYGLETFEQQELGPDETIYSLHKFVRLAFDCNPNIIEILYTDPQFILFINQYGQKLRDNRHIFLSKRARYSFGGYAFAQLKRIKGHRKWIMFKEKEPREEDFWKTKYRKLSDGSTKPYDKFLEQEYHNAQKKWKQYLDWKKNRNPDKAKLEEQYGYDCYLDSETEFLTEEGWKKFDEIQNKYKLATVRPNIHTIQFQYPIKTIAKRYSGNLYIFENKETSCAVTETHRMFLAKCHRLKKNKHSPYKNLEKFNFIDANQIKNNYFASLVTTKGKKKAIYLNKKLRESINPIKSLFFPDFLNLVALYVSEGCVGKYNKKGEPTVLRISQMDDNKDSSIYIKNTMRQIQKEYPKLRIREYKYPRINRKFKEIIWTVANKRLAKCLVEYCGEQAKNKTLPNWIFKMNTNEAKDFIDMLIAGDGTKRKNGMVYYSNSKKLIDQLQALCLLAGYNAKIWNAVPTHQLYIKEQKMTILAKHNKHIKIKSVKNERVVCFTVPNGTLITRRNGKVAIQGNCKHAMHLVRLQRMGYEIMKKGQVSVLRPDREELLAIRNGQWSYDKLVKYAESMEKELDALYEKSPLPKKPDYNAINKLLIGITEEFLDGAT